VDGSEAIQTVNAIERGIAPVSRRIGKAPGREASSPGALQDGLLNVRSNQLEMHLGNG
jgi:hypothetical protein